MKRPDLTYLTQSEFKCIQGDLILSVRDKESILVAYSCFQDESDKYMSPISKIPQLVQCAEMLFDMTLKEPKSIVHLGVKELLLTLKQK